MGTYATAFALVCCACIAAAVWTGTVLSILAVGIYAYFDRIFGAKLQRGRADSFKDGYDRGFKDGERLKKYNESELPKTAREAEESKSYAESLIGLMPNNPELKAEVEALKKERKLLDSVE
jgi:hypothetical protein